MRTYGGDPAQLDETMKLDTMPDELLERIVLATASMYRPTLSPPTHVIVSLQEWRPPPLGDVRVNVPGVGQVRLSAANIAPGSVVVGWEVAPHD